MGMYLDLDDVAAGHQIAEAQLSAMREEIEMLRAEINQLRPVVEAAEGLCFGEDWNNGTHARIHRPRLIAALRKLTPNA